MLTRPNELVRVQPPPGFNWPFVTYPLKVYRNGTTYGSAISTDFVAEKYINPLCWSKIYHVNVATGNDGNTGLGSYTGDFSNALQTIHQAVTLGNATSAPYMVLVYAGTYSMGNSFNGTTGIVPTQDSAFFAYGGRVVNGAFDPSTYTLDGTQTNCYTTTTSLSARVFDLLNQDEFGNYKELKYVTTPTLANSTPGSFAVSGTTVYVHRADGAAATSSNTRLYKTYPSACLLTASVPNIYFNGFDFEGGQFAAQYSNNATLRTGNTVSVNCTFKYSGVASTISGANAISFDNTAGLAAYVGCTAQASYNDGFGWHWDNVTYNQGVASGLYPLTINCKSYGCGTIAGSPATGNVSVNGWTTHDGIIGIDIGGDYQFAAGANAGSVIATGTVQPTQAWFVGTRCANSRGDFMNGGTQVPQDFWIANTVPVLGTQCTYWLDGCYSGSGTSGTHASNALSVTNGAAMYTRNVTNSSGTTNGTISVY